MADERIFTDMAGVEWRVHAAPPGGAQESEDARGNSVPHAEQPAELWFTSSRGEQRVLAPVPPDWRTAFADTLAFFCDQARVVERDAP